MSYAYIKSGKNGMSTYNFVYGQTFRAYSDLGRSHEKFTNFLVPTVYGYDVKNHEGKNYSKRVSLH